MSVEQQGLAALHRRQNALIELKKTARKPSAKAHIQAALEEVRAQIGAVRRAALGS